MGDEKEGFHKVYHFLCSALHPVNLRSLWHLVTDSFPPQEASDLAEDLGIEYDTREHIEVEKGPVCAVTKR